MLSKNQLGFLYMFMSVCAFSIMDIIVKWSIEYPIGQVLFFRGFFGIIFYFCIIPRDRLHNFYLTKRAGLHFLRCLSGLIALVAIFIALRSLPLATVVSISFAAPIFTTIFSIFLLNEKVGLFRWLAVLVGFIGILVITEPGISSLNIYYVFPIIFCLGLSYVAIAIRQLSTSEPVWLISFYFSLAITLLSFLTIPQGWIMPDLRDFLLLSMVGIFGGVANLWLSQSYKYSEVSLVTPLKYLALVFAIFFGYFIWNEIPTIKTLFGAALVIISTMIIFRREIYQKKISRLKQLMTKVPKYWKKAKKNLSKKDKIMARLIKSYESPSETILTSRKDIFYSLCKSIIGQQISVAAANSVFFKFKKKCNNKINARIVSRLTFSQIKSCGLSRQKVKGIKSLAKQTLDKTFNPKLINKMDDEEAIKYLSNLRQIGRWSAEMILLFTYNRSNIWPIQDIGLLRAISNNYKKKYLPPDKFVSLLKKRFSPYCSVATWYLWRSIDPEPIQY